MNRICSIISKNKLYEIIDNVKIHGRDNTITELKGIGILLMMLGHCTALPVFLYNYIYSFHMPLFFICSGLFYKKEDNLKLTQKLLDKLVRPYAIFGLVTIIVCLMVSSSDIVYARIQGFIFGNGSPLNYPLFNLKLGIIGPIWFLMALFWCRISYNLINCCKINALLLSVIISIVATIVGRYIIAFPFSMLEGFSALIFYAAGVRIRSFSNIQMTKAGFVVILLLWCFCCNFSSLRMSEFFYYLYPIDIVAAIFGTYFIYLLCRKMCKSVIAIIFRWCGDNSLTLLCIHQLMLQIQVYLPYAYSSGWISFAYNILITILLTFMINKFKLNII